LAISDTHQNDHGYRPVLTRLADCLGVVNRVVVEGLRTDVPEVLATVPVAVMPTLNEALSNVLLESMAAGAPVVATRVGGTPEAIEDVVNGLLVPPGDAMALADSISHVLMNPVLATRLGRAARQTIDERFSMERMVSATEHLYESLLDGPSRLAALARTEFACK